MDIKYMDTLEDFFETLDSSLSLLSSGVILNPLDDLYDKTDALTIQQLTDDMHALDALILYTSDPDTPLASNDVYIQLFKRFHKRSHFDYTRRLLAGEPLTRAENDIATSQYYIDLFKERKAESCPI